MINDLKEKSKPEFKKIRTGIKEFKKESEKKLFQCRRINQKKTEEHIHITDNLKKTGKKTKIFKSERSEKDR